jgi:hypothetical protein
MGGHLERMANANNNSAAAAHRMKQDSEFLSRVTDKIWYDFEKTGRVVYNISRHIASSTLDLVKWSSILTGVSTALGGFGLGRLAGSAAGELRTARGLGVTTAERQAFGINYQRAFDDPMGVLSNIANAQSSLQGRAAFNLLGIDYNKGDAAQIAPETLAAVRKRFMQSDRSIETANALKLTDIVPFEALRTMAAMSDKEFGGMGAGMARDTKRLEMGSDVGQRFQNFVNQLDLAAAAIENVLKKSLVGLSEPLGAFADKLVKVVEAMQPRFAEWIDKLGKAMVGWIDGFDPDKFAEGVKRFASGLEGLAEILWKFVGWFGSKSPDGRLLAPSGIPFFQKPFPSTLTPEDDPNRAAPAGGSLWNRLTDFHPNPTNPGNLRPPGSSTGFQRFSSPEEGVRAMRDQLNRYAPGSENDTGAYVRDVATRMGTDPNRHLDLHDPDTMASLQSAMLIHENGRQNAGYTPHVVVTINNNTGGSAVVSTSQVASSPRYAQ